MEYWKICIEEALCEAGIKATEKQINLVTEWVEGAHENYGMATGQECIPNPMESEADELKRKLKKQDADHEKMIYGITKGVAKRRNVSVSDVSIDTNGLVTYK